MFESIRAMVDQKTSFLETAELLYDEATGIPDDVFAEDGAQIGDDFDLGDQDPADDDEDNDDRDTDDVPDNIDDMMNVKFSTDTSAPSASDDDDLLSVTIDLRSGTTTDVLPVPPLNAGDAMAEDPLSTRVSDGFGEGLDFTEKAKPQTDKFSVYDVSFTVPAEVSKFAGSFEKDKLTKKIKDAARTSMIKMIGDAKNIAKIEADILKEERNIGESTDTDTIRIERIKKYLAKGKVGAFICSKTGKRSFLEIKIPYIKGITCAWLEHGLYIDSSGGVISFDGVDAYTEAVITEAITIDGDDKGDKSADAKVDDGTGDEPSTVTDAVMDKVAESELPDELAEANGSPEAQLKIQDKLDKLQKDIIGLKDMVKKGFN